MAHQRAWGRLLAAGLRARGFEPVEIDAGAPAETRVVACWGWRVGRAYRAALDGGLPHEVLVAERGYLGDRFAFTSLGWNGLNGRADFNVERFGLSPAPRRDFGVAALPWKTPRALPRRVLLLGQVRGDMALRVAGIDLEAWLAVWAARWASAGSSVAFRPHPKDAGLRVPGAEALDPGYSLGSQLAEADLAATVNSNSAVEAVLAGVPTVTADRGAMAWPVTSRPGAQAITPERDAWLARLTWCQWSEDELADGSAVAHAFAGRESMGEAA
jgi:hypothetical protein